MNEKISAYLELMIHEAFDFWPIVNVTKSGDGYLAELDGNENARRQMMGIESATFFAIKRLLLIWSKRNKVFVLLQIKRHHETNFS